MAGADRANRVVSRTEPMQKPVEWAAMSKP
jgi:hypothetical protein